MLTHMPGCEIREKMNSIKMILKEKFQKNYLFSSLFQEKFFCQASGINKDP